jgi:hypothetical protein
MLIVNNSAEVITHNNVTFIVTTQEDGNVTASCADGTYIALQGDYTQGDVYVNSKPVGQYTTDDNYVITYNSTQYNSWEDLFVALAT